MISMILLFTDSVALLENEINMWTVDENKLLSPIFFYEARVSEVILNAMLSGRLRGACPISLQRYLGLLPELFSLPNPVLTASRWPFQGIVLNPDENGFTFVNLDEVKRRLPRVDFKVGQAVLCNRFLEARKSLREQNGQPQEAQFVHDLMKLIVDIIVLFQLNCPGSTGQKSLRDSFVENRNRQHRIKHCSAMQLLDKLMLAKSTNFRFFRAIIHTLTEELGGNVNVFLMLTYVIYEKVKEEGYPLRVTLGSTEWITAVAYTKFPMNANVKRAWIRSLVTMNQDRKPSVSGACIFKLVMNFCSWAEQNPQRFDMVDIAKNIQRIFDSNKLFKNFEDTYGDFLLRHWRADEIGKTTLMSLIYLRSRNIK